MSALPTAPPLHHALSTLADAFAEADAGQPAWLRRCWRALRTTGRDAAQNGEPAVAVALGHLALGLQHLAAEQAAPGAAGLHAATHACSALARWLEDREEQHALQALFALSLVDWLPAYDASAADALGRALAAVSQARQPRSGDQASGGEVLPDRSEGLRHLAAAGTEGVAAATDRSDNLAQIQLYEPERELVLQALQEQVLPALVNHSDGDAGFSMGLLANALDAIGLRVLAMLMQAMGEALADASQRPATTAVLVAVGEYFAAAASEPQALIDAVCTHGRAGWPDADELQTELGSVQFASAAPASAAPRAPGPEELDLAPASDVLNNVLSSMLRGLPQHAEQLGRSIRAALVGDRAALEAATRTAHTLKGDANTVGVRGLAHLTHLLEDALLALARAPEAALIWTPALQAAADMVEEIADHLIGRAPAPPGLADTYAALAALVFEPSLVVLPPGTTTAPSAAPVPEPKAPAPETTTETPAEAHAALSIHISTLDQLQKLSAELLVMSRQMAQQLDGLNRAFNDLSREIKSEQSMVNALDDLVSLRGAALRSAALRAGELDALELDQYTELHGVSRRIMEANTDHQTLAVAIQAQLRQIDDMRGLQEQINEDLSRMVQRARALPFDDVAARLQRVVRQTARTLEKEVSLEIVGGDTLIDADVLQALVEPLSHALRNAIDHGIESAATRAQRGKPAIGRLRIHTRAVGDHIAIDIEDDGNGLDEPAILARAQNAGLIEDSVRPDPGLLARLLSRPGFTTRDKVTQTSGRGVGMDVIQRRVQSLRGQLALQSAPGAGTRLMLRIPASQALVNVVVAHGGPLVLAIVNDAVEQVLALSQLSPELDAQGRWTARVGDLVLPLVPIEALAGDERAAPVMRAQQGLALLVRTPSGRQLVAVDAVDEVGKAIVKPLSALLPPIPAVRGICQLADGRLAPVVDIDQLLDVRPLALEAQQAPSLQGPPCIVVADDSLSVRRALEQLLQDAGYQVSPARDGLEAINQILNVQPAAVLLDLEMPKMNGLEVTRFLRTHTQLARTPVVMVTSRASGKYQTMAQEAGVDRLIGKPYSEDQLLATVEQLIAARTSDP